MKVTVYHYPKCSTSCAALSYLKLQNIECEIIHYCENGITKNEILRIMKLLHISEFKDLIKRNGITYRNLGLAHKTLNNEEWLETIMQNPKLLQRPIIINGNLAIVGKSIDIIKAFLKL